MSREVNPAQVSAEGGHAVYLRAELGLRAVLGELAVKLRFREQDLFAASERLLAHPREQFLDARALLRRKLQLIAQLEHVPRARVTVAIGGQGHPEAFPALKRLPLLLQPSVVGGFGRSAG